MTHLIFTVRNLLAEGLYSITFNLPTQQHAVASVIPSVPPSAGFPTEYAHHVNYNDQSGYHVTHETPSFINHESLAKMKYV